MDAETRIGLESQNFPVEPNTLETFSSISSKPSSTERTHDTFHSVESTLSSESDTSSMAISVPTRMDSFPTTDADLEGCHLDSSLDLSLGVLLAEADRNTLPGNTETNLERDKVDYTASGYLYDPEPDEDPPFVDRELSWNAVVNTREFDAVTSSYWKIFSYSDGIDCLLMLLGTIGAVLHGAVIPTNMFLFGKVVNALGSQQGNPHAASREVNLMALYLFIAAINTTWVTWLEVACWMYTGERQTLRLRTKYLEALLHQEIGFYDTLENPAILVARMQSDTHLLQELMGKRVAPFLHNMSTFVAGMTYAIVNGWDQALLTVATLPLLLAAGGILTGIYIRYLVKGEAAYIDAISIAGEAISQVRTVYSYVAESKTSEAFSEALKLPTQYAVKSGFYKGLAVSITYGIIYCTWSLQLWYGGIAIGKGVSNGGKLVSNVFSVVFGGLALAQAIPELQTFARGRVAAAKLFEVINRKPTAQDKGTTIQKLQGSIDFVDVHFRYPGGPPHAPVFSGLSLYIPAGQTVALVGGRGSGKSTVLSLIERFYDPISGQVQVDGVDITTLNLPWLRKQISMVSQEPVLFGTSIRENILHGKDGGATDEEIEVAARAACAHSFIENLSNGYNTQIGDPGGVMLSRAQKQRIAIARAILKNSRIFLLDEYASALDSDSQLHVQAALNFLVENKTTIVVGHQLATTQNVDCIFVLEEGQIAEMGTHSALLEIEDGLYKAMVLLQEQKAAQDSTKLYHSTSISPIQLSTPNNRGGSPKFTNSPKLLNVDNNSRPRTTLAYESGVKEISSEPSLRVICTNFLNLLRSEWHMVGFGSLGASLTGLVSPIFAILLIDVIVIYYDPVLRRSPHDLRRFVNLKCLGILVVGIVICFTSCLQHYLFGHTCEQVSRNLQEKTFEAIMKKEVAWFDQDENSSYAITNNLATNRTLIRVAISDCSSLVVQYSVAIFFSIISAFIIEWRMACVCVATLPFLISAASMKGRFVKKGFGGDLIKAHEQSNALVGEAISNIRTVASFCLEQKILDRFSASLEVSSKESFRRSQLGGILFGAAQGAQGLAASLSLWFAGYLVGEGTSSYSAALKAFQVLVWIGYINAELSNLLPDIKRGVKGALSLQTIINLGTEIDPNSASGETLDQIKGEIFVNNVVFQYPSRPRTIVLNKVTLKIEAGTRVALVGSSGSGGSSILSLIERFYDPISGSVLIDGRDVKTLNLKWLRKQIGLVQQEPALFATTIRQNILYGVDFASELEIVEAAQAANAHRFISTFPLGYDTDVGQGGVQLSCGQKQRIAIARVILKNPSILLLDEAFGSLVSYSEKTAQEALQQVVRGNRTTIVVAHRLSTIQNADVIVVMDNGEVIQQGSHLELMRQGGAYAHMVHLQEVAPS